LIRDKSLYTNYKQYLASEEKKQEQDKGSQSEFEHFGKHLPSFLKKALKIDEKPVTEKVPEGAGKAMAEIAKVNDSQFVSEIIYIHSKLMIVDDRLIICGSANINDRSMCGDRDSELAIVVEDQKMIDSVMDGKPYKVGRLAHALRCKIFREHSGLDTESQMSFLCKLPAYRRAPSSAGNPTIEQRIQAMVQDPLSSQFWDFWTGTAKSNTDIFREVFKCVPDDNIRNWTQYKNFFPKSSEVLSGHIAMKAPIDQIREKLFSVHGHLVQFPTDFLSEEALKAEKFSVESVTPEDVFT